MSEAHCSRTDMFAKMVTIWKRELRKLRKWEHLSQKVLYR